jgi:hypothetical protein
MPKQHAEKQFAGNRRPYFPGKRFGHFNQAAKKLTIQASSAHILIDRLF